MERLITNRLAYYLESQNLLNPVQSGFRKNRSTIDHLVRLTDHINKTINTGDYTVATFIDFSNAFDMVWKQGLLHKLQKLGIGGNMLNFINDFLTDRSIRVKVGSTLSEEFKLDNGSPLDSAIIPQENGGFNDQASTFTSICLNGHLLRRLLRTNAAS